MIKKKHGHYCCICGMYKSNESFSGSGHANHICKKCEALLSEENKTNNPVIREILQLPRRLTKQQKEWMENLMNDNNPEVAKTAEENYAIRFPHDFQKEIEKKYQIKHIELTIDDDLMNESENGKDTQTIFILDSKSKMIQMINRGELYQVQLKSKSMRKLLKRLITQYEIYRWKDFQNISDFSSDLPVFDEDWLLDEHWVWDKRWMLDEEIERSESIDSIADFQYTGWKMSVSYENGETQEICESDIYLPDYVGEVVSELQSFFEDGENFSLFKTI